VEELVMNQKAKKARRRLSPDGLPIDKNAWLVEDWRSLHVAIGQAKREIAERHKEKKDGTS
jgi:hypothetical protein